MSINSSPFHAQSQMNYKLPYMQQDFHYQDQTKEGYSNQMNNSMNNLYNQYHSPLSMSKEDINTQLLPVLSNKEKRNELELNMLIKKSETNSNLELMKINIIKFFEISYLGNRHYQRYRFRNLSLYTLLLSVFQPNTLSFRTHHDHML